MNTMNQYKVLLAGPMPKAATDLFDARDDVVYEAITDVSEANLLEKMRDVDGITVRTADITANIIKNSPNLKVVSRFGVGYDSIDVPAMDAHGIPLTIVGTANSVAVAEAALYMMLELAKEGFKHDQEVRKGNWNYRLGMHAIELWRKKVLIVGFGRIGTRVAPRCLAFDMDVYVLDPYVDDSVIKAAGCTPVSDLRAALPDMDYVTLHLPLSDATCDAIGAEELALMKPDAILINAARGNIVNEDALFEALSSGGIRGAGLDVLAAEPADKAHPLFTLENIVISPHIAGVTYESANRMAVACAQNVLDVFDGKVDPENVVNKTVLGDG
ncbi:MAG: hydroxyacid dehydrogenase [Rhodospirillaceae bacterium]|jgi:D-3-phosphoglycerate dehydrogenase / 2-oxoglutarate reductase|nr:hydroxyacid dehydrogenase [Rhodospirillaceae bacterium]MBT5665799.1 hydroxyacid dehydrogenase [Rhodospirillaceae bacterium]